MIRIGTQEEVEKKRKRNIIILSAIMLFLMIFGTIGYAFSSGDSSESKKSKDGINIRNAGDYWIVESEGQIFYFRNEPEAVANVSFDAFLTLEQFVSKPLYIDSNNSAVMQEIAGNLGRYAERVQPACYEKCELDLPQKDCTSNLVVFRQGEEEKIYQNQSCIFIEGSMRAADAFLYKVLGIN